MRLLKHINEDLARCRQQIAATYDNHETSNSEEIIITREGFQNQLIKLEHEKQQHIKTIKVVAPTAVNVNRS